MINWTPCPHCSHPGIPVIHTRGGCPRQAMTDVEERIKLLHGGLIAIMMGIMPGRDPNSVEDIRAEARDILERDERLEREGIKSTVDFYEDKP